MARLRISPAYFGGAVGLAIGSGVIAYLTNFMDFKTRVNLWLGWPAPDDQIPDPTEYPTPIPLPSGVSEDDVKAVGQAVVAYIQSHATYPLQGEYLQGLVDAVHWTFRQQLINLVIQLWSINCITEQKVCTDQEAETGLYYIRNTAEFVTAKYNLTMSPTPLRVALATAKFR